MDVLNTDLELLGAFRPPGPNFSAPWLPKQHKLLTGDPAHKPTVKVRTYVTKV